MSLLSSLFPTSWLWRSTVPRQTSKHFCGPQCQCTTAVCHICFGLDWRLLDGYSSDPLKSRKRVRFETTRPILEKSASLGCKVCLWLTAIINYALKDTKDADITDVVVYGFRTKSLPPYAQASKDITLEDWTTIDLVKYLPQAEGGQQRRHQELDLPHELELENFVEITKSWIENCVRDHPFCYLPSDICLPFRVLDVGDLENPAVKLVQTNGALGIYIALSHCWGGDGGILTTTMANIGHREQGIEWASFPQTFRDAILITQSLGIRYLWIDSLCIVQDDIEEWELESAKMGNVYTNSFLTISALHAANSSGGLFPARCQSFMGYYRNSILPIGPVEVRQRSTREGTNNIVPCNLSDGHRNFVGISEMHFKENFDTSPLLTRAWAFQERLLATRTVHVHDEELFWECKSCNKCECRALDNGNLWVLSRSKDPFVELALRPPGLKGLYAQICSGGKSMQEIADFWLEMISRYSGLRLTHESDRLIALSGLATNMSKLVDSQYFAGLWAFDLTRSLLWRRVDTTNNIHEEYVKPQASPLSLRMLNELKSDICPPTWSWAHLSLPQDQALRYENNHQNFLRIHYRDDPNVKVISTTCVPSGKNAFGPVQRGLLTIRGSFISGACEFVERGLGANRRTALAFDKSDNAEVIWDDPALEHAPAALEGETIYALLVGSVDDLRISKRKIQRIQQGLALKRSRRVPDAYERIGVLVVDSDEKIFVNAAIATVDIV